MSSKSDDLIKDEDNRDNISSFRLQKRLAIFILGLAVLSIFIFAFQNCEDGAKKIMDSDSTTTTAIGNGDNEDNNEDNKKEEDDSTKEPTTPSSSENPLLGSLIAYLHGDAQKTPQDQFDVGQQVILEFVKSHKNSNSFQWTASRGFKTVTNVQATNQSDYTASFDKKGIYDISSTSHVKGDPKILSRASKRLTIGTECDASYILETNLKNGSLKNGETVTFELEDSQLFTDIKWRIQQPPQKNLLEQTGQSVTVDLAEEGDSLTVEMTALDADPSRAECLTYRRKEFQINKNSKPHFNFVRPIDETHPVILENNDIYKYKRTSRSKYIQVHVTGAQSCGWGTNSIACNGGERDITQDDLDISECKQAVASIKAFYLDGNNISKNEQKFYYKFCPEDQDFCYFGPSDVRPNHHYCSTSVPPARDPASVCSSTQKAPDYKAVNGQCLKSCQVAGGTHTGTTDCAESKAYDLVLIEGTYESPCCKRTPKQAVNGQCNNNVQNACISGHSSPQESSGGFYRWHCNGINGGTDAINCQKAQSSNAVNGRCNNSIINGCNPGNAVAQQPSGGFHRWHCDGINGGTNATNCQKAIAVNGQCDNSTKFTCSSGTPDNRIELADAYTWHCIGLHGGITAGNCRKGKPVNGQCNNDTQNACIAGTSSSQAASGGFFRWHCNGINGGTNATNCQKAQPVNGQCDDTQKNGCLVGRSDPQPESNGFYNWYCRGEHGGTDASCKFAAGSRCNYPDTITDYINSCKSGATFSDRIDDADYYKWACNNEVCERLKPFHGECSDTPGQCARGVAGTVSAEIENYANSGYYVLPELPNPSSTSKTINEDINYHLSTLDRLWSCEGGLSKVYCRATQDFVAQCPGNPPAFNSKNHFVNYCVTGYVQSPRYDIGQEQYTWICRGTGRSGSTRQTCTRDSTGSNAPPPADQQISQGECSKQRYNCRGGVVKNRLTKSIPINYTYRTRRYNSATQKFEYVLQRSTKRNVSIYTWECEGSGRSAVTQKCQETSLAFEGVCDNTSADTCHGGVLYNLDDSKTHYRWMCFGQGDVGNASRRGHVVYCSRPKFQVIENADGTQSIQAY